jgi:hypothetical protein
MALTGLSYTETEGRYISEVYTPATSNMAVGVKFSEKPGAATVERSIDGGVNWVVAGAVATVANDSRYVLQNVCGFVAGEVFRIITTEEPESIHILEAD